MAHYEFHEYANIFPLLEGNELEALRADIDANGQINKIILHQGKILDGRNRYAVCGMLAIEPETIEYPGDDPLGLVLSQNLRRRHLDASQRAMIAEKLANMQHGGTRQNEAGSKAQICALPSAPVISRAKAAKLLAVSERQVDNAAQLRREAPSKIIEQVEQGEKTIHAALKEIGQPVPGKDGKIRPAKYQPRKKTVAKNDVLDEEPDFGVIYEEWQQDMQRLASGELTNVKTPAPLQNLLDKNILKFPLPVDHLTAFIAFAEVFRSESEEIRNRVINEIRLLADVIDNLND
jgi:hypothetical protein